MPSDDTTATTTTATTTIERHDDVEQELLAEARAEIQVLRHRARSLRQQADHLDDVLAVAYRRRASELEMEAWVLEVQSLPAGGAHPA